MGVRAEELTYQFMAIKLILKAFHSSLQRSMLSVNVSGNIKITKPEEVRFPSNCSEHRNIYSICAVKTLRL